jgi:hypothetical protein
MLAGALFLWVAVPAGWLWIGSQVQNSAGVGTAIMVSFVGAIGSILAVVPVLTWLNRKHVEFREAHGEAPTRHTALEVIMVATAAVATIGFSTWFFLFAGTSPVPLNLGF